MHYIDNTVFDINHRMYNCNLYNKTFPEFSKIIIQSFKITYECYLNNMCISLLTKDNQCINDIVLRDYDVSGLSDDFETICFILYKNHFKYKNEIEYFNNNKDKYGSNKYDYSTIRKRIDEYFNNLERIYTNIQISKIYENIALELALHNNNMELCSVNHHLQQLEKLQTKLLII